MSRIVSFLILAAFTFLTPPRAHAGQRHYVYSYETLTAPKGSWEFEQWVTWKHGDITGGDDRDRWEFRHEFEFGVTDKFQIGLYLADWQYDDDDSEGHHARYKGTGVEAIYNLTNPNTAFLGSAIYGEIVVGEDLLKLEGKLLLEKRFGPLSIVYNAVLEAEWEGSDLDEKTGEFQQTVGVSYDLSKSFSAGVEAFHEIEMPDWSETESGRIFAGPNVSVRKGRFFGTLAWLWQVTHIEDEPDFQTRLIFGVDF